MKILELWELWEMSFLIINYYLHDFLATNELIEVIINHLFLKNWASIVYTHIMKFILGGSIKDHEILNKFHKYRMNFVRKFVFIRLHMAQVMEVWRAANVI